MNSIKEPPTEKKQQIILNNKHDLIISGTNKIISLKPELIQLNTVYGDLQIIGNKLELLKLDNESLTAQISGDVNAIKFLEIKNKEPLFRKIFKWFFQQ